MTQTLKNSYLQRYEQKQSKDNSPLVLANLKSPSQEQLSLPSIVSNLSERVDGVEVKLTSLVNVVKLLQKYTETRDDQYEKQKENLILRKGNNQNYSTNQNEAEISIELRVKQFQLLARNCRQELRSIEKLRQSFKMQPLPQKIGQSVCDSPLMENRLRDEINKKMQICMQLITEHSFNNRGIIEDKVNTLAFDLNQIQNQCKRGLLTLQQEIDKLLASANKQDLKATRKQQKSKSKENPSPRIARGNSHSQKSLSKSKVKTGASRMRDEEMRQALRKKKEHKDRLKAKNY